MSDPEKDRPVNKATMDAPQEEFVDDQSVPSGVEPTTDDDRNAELKAETRKAQNDSPSS